MPAAIPAAPGRRLFLGGGAALLSLPGMERGARAAPPRPTVPEAAWRDLAAKVTGGVLRPGDRGFRALTRPQNLRYDTGEPLAVARPRDAAEAAAALTWAQEVGMPMVLRSGGHSYAGCSMVAGLVIHTGLMRSVRHLGDGLVELEGGALNGDVYRALEAAADTVGGDGLVLTHGRCLGVGASAFLLGGGIGFAMREHGLGCDAVQEAEMVLADGRILRAAADENAELFWALRGGGGGTLGMATRFRLRAAAAAPVTVFRMAWRERAEAVFLALTRALEAAPDRMGCKVTVEATRPGSHHPNTVSLLGQLRGTEEEVLAILAPATGIARPAAGTVRRMRYWEGQRFVSDLGSPARYQETSRYCGTIPEGAVEAIFRHCRSWPGTTGEAQFKMFHAGGRIRAAAPESSAFVHRDAEWLTGTELTWTERDTARTVRASLAWQRAFHEATADLLGPGGSYQNFPDPGLRDAASAYYGANLVRLRAVKRAVDPAGAFTPPRGQGIQA